MDNNVTTTITWDKVWREWVARLFVNGVEIVPSSQRKKYKTDARTAAREMKERAELR